MRKKSTFMELLSLFVILFLLNSSFTSKSVYRNPATLSSVSNTIPNTGWILDKTIEKVECFHMFINCEGHQVVLLKFNNRNPFKVKITWKEVFDTQAQKEVEGFLGQQELILPTGETGQFDCSVGKNPSCIIRPIQVSIAYAVEIKQFSFKDITVTPIGK